MFPRLLVAVAVLFACPALVAQSAAAPDPAAPIRVLLRARHGGADKLTSLRYIGGFETKSLLYETLVVRGPDGRIAPGLASRWWCDETGTTWCFQLRAGARFHDGTAVTAEAVRQHFQRWVGLPEHNWLAINRRITGMSTSGDAVFRIHLSEPYAVTDDLCAINPCAVVWPGARDWEGEFQRPIGTGPFRFVASLDGGARWRLERVEVGGSALEVGFLPRGRDRAPIDALLAGSTDVFVGGWDEDLPEAALAELRADGRFVIQEAPGSSVAYVSFRLADGPTAEPAIRRRIQAAIDRAELIQSVEHGRGDATTAWAAASVAFWPRGSLPKSAPAALDGPLPKLKIATGASGSRTARIAEVLQVQLVRAGFEIELLRPPTAAAAPVGAPVEATATGAVRPLDAESGDVRRARNRALRELADTADLRIEITHGVPYDPHQALAARFGPTTASNADQPRPRFGVDPRLLLLVASAMATGDEVARQPIYAELQMLIDREALLVPLYSPRRLALRRAEVDGIGLPIDVYRVDLSQLRRRDR